jgi:hypothetical protein
MNKKDIDGLHKDKFHRLAPSSFTISVLFDYILTPPSIVIQSDLSIENKIKPDLKLIESNNDSTLIIGPSEKLIDKDELKQNNDKLTITNNNKNLNETKSRLSSSKKRTFNLYTNGVSDWDSTDSEPGINEINDNYGEPESCQTRF